MDFVKYTHILADIFIYHSTGATTYTSAETSNQQGVESFDNAVADTVIGNENDGRNMNFG